MRQGSTASGCVLMSSRHRAISPYVTLLSGDRPAARRIGVPVDPENPIEVVRELFGIVVEGPRQARQLDPPAGLKVRRTGLGHTRNTAWPWVKQ